MCFVCLSIWLGLTTADVYISVAGLKTYQQTWVLLVVWGQAGKGSMVNLESWLVEHAGALLLHQVGAWS